MGETEFHCAATRGVPVSVRLLLGGEAWMGSCGWHGETSLFTVRYRDAGVVEHLIERDADINEPIGPANVSSGRSDGPTTPAHGSIHGIS